ncbi:MAG TPA: DoxX family protein [Pararhizobium sp.]|uniref:DoxX family protein n=1 Tax=Pararhizobium sp. TaxID=1977563 RepID=UPI002CEC9940|nr:DoxX family protein [Pararhizobium sp.]HTO34274.1 DoxX family protein [Pararhizobium sp.]
MPSFLATLVNSRAFGYLARTILTYMFWASGLAKLIDFNAGVAEMAFFGLEPAPLFNIAVAVTQLGGSALIIANRWTWLGAGALGIFTALTIPIAHTFWTMQEPMKTLEFYVVMEHITVIGALMVVTWKSAPSRDFAASPHATLAARGNV